MIANLNSFFIINYDDGTLATSDFRSCESRFRKSLMTTPSHENDNEGATTPTKTTTAEPVSQSVKMPKVLAFRDLCRCGDEVWIENDGQIYRLRRTKLGKLILTK